MSIAVRETSTQTQKEDDEEEEEIRKSVVAILIFSMTYFERTSEA